MIAETLATQTNNTGLTLRDKLLLVRHQVERSHTHVATQMLDALIVEVEHDAELHRIVNAPSARRNGRKPTALLSTPNVKAMRKATNGKIPEGRCPYNRYTQSGRPVKNQRHKCRPACVWTPPEIFAWLATTPYRIGPGVEIMPRLVPVPPCANCDRTRSAHWEPAADEVTGRLTGYRAIKECAYTPVEAAA